MEIAKAVVLTGRSPDDRPWPSVRSMPKPLVPVANRPMLFHNLEALRCAGVLEAIIAVEPDTAAAIRQAVGDGSDWDMGVRYLDFRPDMRIEHALGLARDFVGDEPVLVQRAGALLRERMHPFITAFASERLDALALRGRRVRTRRPHVDGGWFLSPRAISILMKDAARDPDPLTRRSRGRGARPRPRGVDDCLPCQGGQDTLLEANRRMLEEMAPDVEPACLERSQIQGPAVVHPTARLENSLVRGPAIIGPRARLRDAYVGPYTSIGADVVMEGAEIEHSIVFSAPRSATWEPGWRAV